MGWTSLAGANAAIDHGFDRQRPSATQPSFVWVRSPATVMNLCDAGRTRWSRQRTLSVVSFAHGSNMWTIAEHASERS